MINKKECEIVQDLLVNYTDGILNPKSKRLVEEHLAECEICQNQLKQIKEDIKDIDNKEKIELDYLRKIRIKTRIKSVLMAIGIILLIILGIFLNNFAKINSIINRAEKSLKSNNIYMETSQIMDDNRTVITKDYYKDGKYKRIWQVYSDSGIESSIVYYADVNSDKRICIYEAEKKAIIEQGDTLKALNSEDNIIVVPFVQGKENLFSKIGKIFIYSIDESKDYYILKDRELKDTGREIWFDKKTGLPIKEITREGEKRFFPGTDVVKEIRDVTVKYKYEFDKVTNEDVEVPDLSTYTVEYRFGNIDD